MVTAYEAQLTNQRLENIEKIFNIKLESSEKLIEQKLELQNRAVNMSSKNMEVRLDKLNELRNEVVEDRSRYITLDRYELQNQLLNNQIKNLELGQAKIYWVAIGISIGGGISGGIITKLIGL